MEYSRRHLFRVGQAALAAAALPRFVFGAELEETGFRLTQKGFAPLVSESFRVQSEGGALRWFTLLSVEDMTPNAAAYRAPMILPRSLNIPASPKTETFALHFSSAGEDLSQATYVLEHKATGRLPLFVVPSGNSTYVAVINQLTR